MMNFKMINLMILMIINSINMLFLNSFFMLWIMMEFNTLMFFMLMFYFNSSKMKMMLYLMIQIFSSSSLLFFLFMKMLYSNYLLITNLGLMLSLSLKMGMFPFHSWYPYINKNMNWIIIYFMFTTQKISPIILSSYVKYINMMLIIMLFTSILSSINMMYSLKFKYIMSYSSLIHTCWMMMMLMMSEKNFLYYMLMYMILSYWLMFMFNKFNMNFINQSFMINNYYKMMLYLLMMSYMSLPPFSGFYLKWLSIMESNLMMFNLTCMMMISSVNAMFMYLKITLPINLKNEYKKWITTKFNMMKLKSFFYLSMFPYLGLIIFMLKYE